ncbi:MAG: RNA methyltransferase [Oscillospiraceae bacterium]|nr:RNA methyltransferase [Oscillospiraceae bacterium]
MSAFAHVITSTQNPQIKFAVKLRDSAKARREHGQFFLEGYRLCMDALENGYTPELLFCTDKFDLPGAVRISESVAQKLGDTVTPQGIFGLFKANSPAPAQQLSGKIIALENLQDPANLGAIARTAEALGIDCLVVSGGCDVYHPKALRASMGALLRLPVTQIEDSPSWLEQCELPCYAAVPVGAAITPPECDFTAGAVIVIGNEGNGLSNEVIAACDARLTIPMRGRAESLNAAAAAAILMWELCK